MTLPLHPLNTRNVDDPLSPHKDWHETLHGVYNELLPAQTGRFNVVDFGGAAIGGIIDASAAIQATIAAAEAITPKGTVVFGPYQFKIDTGITILDCNVESERGAELIVGTGIAAGITIGSSAMSCDHHRLQLPHVTRISRDWDSLPNINTARGVLFKAADGCEVTVGVITDFSFGLVLEGDGQGVAYNVFNLSAHINNAVNIYLSNINGGWANQNTFIGGRNQHSNIGGTPPYAGVYNLHIDKGNGNSFHGVSFEGGFEEFLAFFGIAASNRMVNCRWESSGTPRVTFQGDGAGGFSQANVIEGGIDSDQLIVTPDPGGTARYNSIIGERIQRHEGSGTDGIFLIQNVNGNARAISIFPAGTPLLDRDLSADYGARMAAQSSGWKAEADAFDRIAFNHALGRMLFGLGSAAETIYMRANQQNTLEINATTGIKNQASYWRSGTGNPNGVVSGGIGQFYFQTDGSADQAALFMKTTATGSNGWVEVPLYTPAIEVAGAITLDWRDGVVNMESTAAARAVTLPDNAAFDGKEYIIHCDGTNIVTVTCAGTDTFDTGATSITLYDGDVLHIISIGDGVWKIL